MNTTNGAIIWLTGLSDSGKTTIPNRLKDLILEQDIDAEVLNGKTM